MSPVSPRNKLHNQNRANNVLHFVQVIANETSSTMASKPNVTVTVVVQDVNEFNPVFNQTHYTANVSESSSVETSVAEVIRESRAKLTSFICKFILTLPGSVVRPEAHKEIGLKRYKQNWTFPTCKLLFLM